MRKAVLRAALWVVRLVGGLAVAAGGCAVIVGVSVLWAGEAPGASLPLYAVAAGLGLMAAGFYADVRVTAAERRLNARRDECQSRGYEVVLPPGHHQP